MSDYVPPDATPSELGARVRMIRRRRGLGLAVAASLAGISKSYLSMLENGHRQFDRRGLIEDLARALGCSITDITGGSHGLTEQVTADAQRVLPQTRPALQEYDADDVPQIRPRSLDELTRWADAANEQCSQAQYVLASRDVSVLLAESQAHALTVRAAERSRAFQGAVTACFVAGVVASRLGNVDLAASAARRGYDLARQHDDLGVLGFARWYWALELTSTAARRRASAVLTVGVDELTRAVRWSAMDTLPAEMTGMLHLQLARTAARQRSRDDAHAHLDEADRLARRIGERDGMRQHFGPTNVAAWRVAIGIELSEGARAYEEATRSPLDVAALHSRERASSLHFDLARALAQDDDRRRVPEAVRPLDTADRIAPERVRPDPWPGNSWPAWHAARPGRRGSSPACATASAWDNTSTVHGL